ncbi:hypothetical protein [Bacillus sp. USDA818B3_A]|uniref:hypothetical protein n=1 Tax=Bacillus sp. USDA818B3_A TaxID=2698834 RepID=UPI001F38B5C7|nr:hypothetical protein [Bacillus sp. USDA818B3_A]
MYSMKAQNVNGVRSYLKANKQNSLETSNYLNMPDLQFSNWCNSQFKINRGIYNTIDQWFYEYGIVNIYCRRIQLLAFLDSVKDELNESHKSKFIRFGHGGLTRRLNRFIQGVRVSFK